MRPGQSRACRWSRAWPPRSDGYHGTGGACRASGERQHIHCLLCERTRVERGLGVACTWPHGPRCRHWPTHHALLAVGVAQQQVLAKQRQLVLGLLDAVCGCLSLLENAGGGQQVVLAVVFQFDAQTDIRRTKSDSETATSSHPPLRRLACRMYSPVRPDDTLDKLFALTSTCEARLRLFGHCKIGGGTERTETEE